MCVLSDGSLLEHILTPVDGLHPLVTAPMDTFPPDFVLKSIQPCSVDLHLDKHFIRRLGNRETEFEALGPELFLHPDELILASTVESVWMPPDLAGSVEGKSSIGRVGIFVQNAGHIDPGFHGQITLELCLHGLVVHLLKIGEPICQIVFTQLDKPSLKPYGTQGLGSHYQDQDRPRSSHLNAR